MTREERGLEISKSAHITENEDGSFSVPSQTIEGKSYTVKAFGSDWTCDCPDFIQRVGEIDACKHIIGTRLWIAARVEVRNEPKPQVFANDAIQCALCGSIRVVKYGHANGKQVFKCRDCGKKFREGLIKKTRYTPETITLTLDLYFSGLSLRKITRTLGDHFGLENLGKSTVYRWIETFVPKISAYVNNLNPQLSPDWHADELFVKMKGGARTPNNPKESIAYLWNVMDRKTRFLLASKLSRFRDISGADRALIEAYHNAKGSKPERIYTDALKSYQMAIACWPEDQRPIHIAKSGLRKPVATNNRIEALNGTLRERVKVQRGWKSYKTPLAEGMRIHYNFVKPHSSLEGQTPADNAGVGIAKGDKWMALLKEAIKG